MSTTANYRELWAAGQTGADTGDWTPVAKIGSAVIGGAGAVDQVDSHGREISILVEPYANVWGSCVVAIETRLIGAHADSITTYFTASANGDGEWLDLSDEHEIRGVITGSGGTNVNAIMSGER